MEFVNLTPLVPVFDRLNRSSAVPAAPLPKSHLAETVTPTPTPSPASSSPHRTRSSVLAWPAWGRALAVAPALVLLWVAVAWAMTTVAPL